MYENLKKPPFYLSKDKDSSTNETVSSGTTSISPKRIYQLIQKTIH